MVGDRTLQALLDSLDTVVLGCDTEGRPVLFNRAARDLFGVLLDDGTSVQQWPRSLDVFTVDGRRLQPADPAWMRAIEGERVRDDEVVIHPPGAMRRSFRIHGAPVADGGPVAAVVALHETTLQRRAARLKDCQLQISALLSKPEPPDAAIANAVDLIGDLLDWAAAEFWTLDPVGQVLRRSASWTAPDHELPPDLPDQLSEGEGLPGRAWGSSEPQWASDLHTDAATPGVHWGALRGALAVPIPSGAVTLGVLACYSDTLEPPDDMRTAVMVGIAAHLGEFLERRRAEQFAAELDQTRDEYIALVGHELRTPLTSIQGYTEMMRSTPDLGDQDRARMLEVMHRNTLALHSLVARLLDVAGTRAGHIALRPQRMNLAAVVLAAADQARSADPPARVTVNTCPEVIIDGDPDRLRGVVDELLGNALTWAPGGTTVGVTLHADERTAVLAVSNTGSRIPSVEHRRIFDLFFRTDVARRYGVQGAGLGLTLARAVVEQHGGTISVSEPEEAATTFIVRLPTTHATGG